MPQQKNEITTDVTITIDETPYLEMMQYAHEFSPNECSGVGLVERKEFYNGDVEFNVSKVFLPLQHNTPTTTDIEDEELNKLNTQLVQEGKDTRLLRFHWHSHVDMGVFHSGTDDSNYDDMRTGDFGISLVVNKRYEMLGSVHIYKPLRINVLNVEVAPPDIDLSEYKMPKALRKIIEANVARVKAHEDEQRAKSRVIHPVHSYGRKYDYDYEYSRNTGGFGEGLAYDRELYALLHEGEKQGLLTLVKDNDGYTIVGYMNNITEEVYELTSYLDYCTKVEKGNNGLDTLQTI